MKQAAVVAAAIWQPIDRRRNEMKPGCMGENNDGSGTFLYGGNEMDSLKSNGVATGCYCTQQHDSNRMLLRSFFS